MDEMVYVTQTWLNRTYGNDSRFERIPVEDENVKGRTGWITIYALTRAFQIELGITQTADNFGPTTVARFNERWPNGIQPAGPDEEDNVYAIIQGAMWCKGYSSGHYADDGTLDRHFDDLVAAHIMELKMDAGLSAPDGVVTLNVMKALLSMDYFVIGAGTGGDEGIRSIQQALNRDYEDYIGLRPCDGIYGRGTNEALIYALQKEEGLDIDTANGYFGPTTKRLCPTLPDTAGVIDASTELRLIRLLQYSLYCNGFKNYGILGVFNSTTEQAIKNFQTHYALERNGIADLTTWMSLLTSCGNPDRPAKACDCATILTAEKAATLKNAGYEVVGRYLSGTVVGGASKALSREEIQIIFDAGLRFFPIYQGGAYYAEYFTEEQGRKDAYYAYSYATQLGIPANTIIYFAVDYDAMDYEVTQRIIPYFRAVHEGMQNWNKYRVGIYGARNICTRVSKKGYAVSSFVGDMSTGFSGNLGFTIPDNWAFDQFATVTVGSGDGQIEIDKDGYSGRYVGVQPSDYRDQYPKWTEGTGQGWLKVDRSGSPITVYKNKVLQEATNDYRPGEILDEIPENGCFAMRFNSDDYHNTMYRAVFTGTDGVRKEGYIFGGYDHTADDETYMEQWANCKDFLNYKVDPQTNQLVSNSGYEFQYGTNQYIPYTLKYGASYYKGETYMGYLPAGTEVAISGEAVTGSSYPWRIAVDLIKKNGQWTYLNGSYGFVDLRFDRGNMPENRLLR